MILICRLHSLRFFALISGLLIFPQRIECVARVCVCVFLCRCHLVLLSQACDGQELAQQDGAYFEDLRLECFVAIPHTTSLLLTRGQNQKRKPHRKLRGQASEDVARHIVHLPHLQDTSAQGKGAGFSRCCHWPIQDSFQLAPCLSLVCFALLQKKPQCFITLKLKVMLVMQCAMSSIIDIA